MRKANVRVTLKKSILDPQGSAVEKALKSMAYPIESVRIGKFMEVTVDEEDQQKAEAILHEICQKLLFNPVIEDYSFEWEGRA